MIKWINILFLFVFLFGCASPAPKDDKQGNNNEFKWEFTFGITTEDVKKQQFIVRNLIDNCETFDCSVLEREKTTLAKYVFDEVSPIVLGVQQSIVTSITRRCNKDTDNTPCVKYDMEMKKLKKLLKRYMEK